jgi:hypothetical protein
MGIFDDLLEYINHNDKNALTKLVKDLVKFIEDPHNYQEYIGDIYFMNFFA